MPDLRGSRAPPRSRRWVLVIAVLGLIVLPALSGGAACIDGARIDAERYASGMYGSHDCGFALPRPVAWGCALLRPPASSSGARGLALGYGLGLATVAVALIIDWRRRKLLDASARPARGPMIMAAAGGIAVAAFCVFAMLREWLPHHQKKQQARCDEALEAAKRTWERYQPAAPEAARARGAVLVSLFYHREYKFRFSSLCAKVRDVPAEPLDPVQEEALRATEHAWKTCEPVAHDDDRKLESCVRGSLR